MLAVHLHRPFAQVVACRLLGADAAVADVAQPAGLVEQFEDEGRVVGIEFAQNESVGLEDCHAAVLEGKSRSGP